MNGEPRRVVPIVGRRCDSRAVSMGVDPRSELDRIEPKQVAPLDEGDSALSNEASDVAHLDAAYTARPERFRRPPSAPRIPETTWINPPEETPLATPAI